MEAEADERRLAHGQTTAQTPVADGAFQRQSLSFH